MPDKGHAPGGAWDEAWAADLAHRAVAHVVKRAPVRVGGDACGEADRAHEEIAAEAEDRRRYRRALREWVAAILRSSEKRG